MAFHKRMDAKADRYLARDSLVPELDRIYAGSAVKKAIGHPVHYMIQTDDRDTRKGMYKLLLKALYANGRIQSRRYVYIDFKSGKDIAWLYYDCLYKSCTGGTVIIRYSPSDISEDDHAFRKWKIIGKMWW